MRAGAEAGHAEAALDAGVGEAARDRNFGAGAGHTDRAGNRFASGTFGAMRAGAEAGHAEAALDAGAGEAMRDRNFGAGAGHVVVALDTLVGGVHFPGDTPAFDVGYKALAVNLSDLAAMGATATEAAVVVSVPESLGSAWLAGFRAGLESLAGSAGVAVTAVDTVSGALAASVQAHGLCPAGEAMTRAGARAGDRIFVSGTLGDAGGGLEIALGRRPARPAGSADTLMARLRRPAPRLALGAALRGIASAAIDISDGLCQDLGHVLAASGAGARVDARLLPLSPALRDVAGDAGARALALSAGDDYELLFTVAPDRVDRLGALEAAGSVTGIGVIEPGPGLRLAGATGAMTPAPPGYRHFPPQ